MISTNMSIEELVRVLNEGTPWQQKEAMDVILATNDSLVISLINKHFPSYRYSHMEDMCQEGRIALFEHAKNFDPEKGRFSTFIAPYVIDAVKNYICSLHEISTHYVGQLKRYRKAIEALRARGIDNPTFGQIAEEMHVGLDAVQRVHEISLNFNPISIEGDEKDKELSSPYDATPDAICEQNEFREQIRNAVGSLPVDERRVIRETFFSDSAERELSLAAVADKLGMDIGEVRRLKNLAMRRLRNNLQHHDFTESEGRRELESFANSMVISFALPAEAIETSIDIALTFSDE